MNPYVLDIPGTDPLTAFMAVQHLPYSLLLDSADRTHSAGRYSFIACLPLEMIESKNGRITVTNRELQTTFTGDSFAMVQNRISQWNSSAQTLPGLPPFQGGAAGFFGYDLCREIEALPETATDDAAMPDMAIGIYDQVIAFDHEQDKAWLITHAPDEQTAKVKQRQILGLLEAVKNAKPKNNEATATWVPNFSADEYARTVSMVIEYIRAGDIFQANLSQRFDAELPNNFDAFAHYTHLRSVNPAPFAAFMNLGGVKISSASPERFLTLKEGMVETRPIKGTRPRSTNTETDTANRAALMDSIKDRAENTMIVDLLRSDLSKVCAPDSIEVKSLCDLETFASVHHLVSTITGTLKDGMMPMDLMRACFPGGSITGAPKIRAMEIIEELEPTRRGPYCGSMGYIGFDGAMDTNILIRTLVYKDGRVSFQTGGGITAESSPAGEYQETLDKAEALLRSFEAPMAEKEAV